MKLREIKYIKPDRKPMTLTLCKKMLREAIGLMVLDGVFENEATARRVIRRNVLNRE